MESIEYKNLMQEIEKIKFHNISLITLVGLLNEDKMSEPTIYETVVTFDLSKRDLREFTKLIQNYNGNNCTFEQKALRINPIFTQTNIISILKSLVVSGMFKEKCLDILNSY
ncbi:hypothetical protein D8M04_00720 [Oceanobacillus piezotolerans]|uniref:Uncharacterized protein n=1 Tax=Oceanobacillus piezotolerans TaxID=2448030 RepID=A0A498DCR3_9BACI|nr:hypothetical protein [Oceanobacillus piezotolerans]RLL47836.1 hypothetical protein D8M04_00720 [Oceanobacillus piezotolerans]